MDMKRPIQIQFFEPFEELTIKTWLTHEDKNLYRMLKKKLSGWEV